VVRLLAIAVLGAGCDLVFPLTGPPADAAVGDDGPDLPEGLLAWYPMESVVSGVVADISGNDRDAQCSSCPEPADGKIGGALAFDGVDDHLLVFPADVFSLPQGFTVAAFVKPASPDEPTCIAGVPFGGSVSNSWLVCAGAEHIVFESLHGSGTVFVPDTLTSFGGLPDGEWRHVAIRWEGGPPKAKTILVEGNPTIRNTVAEDTVAFGTTDPLVIGADLALSMPHDHFAGAIDELQIYGRALSDDEIRALARRR
jgi:hypothetical protein